MKRLVWVAVFVVLLTGGAFAIEGGLDAGVGGTFEFGDNIFTEDSDSLLGALGALANLLAAFRVGAYADGRIDILGPISVGAELGVFGFVGSNDSGGAVLTPLVDLSGRAFLRGTLGRYSVQGHVGYNFSTFIDIAADNGLGIAHKLDFGVRATLGAFYIEAMKLFWAGDKRSTRIGLGMVFMDLL
jgi:hypothetical protein